MVQARVTVEKRRLGLQVWVGLNLLQNLLQEFLAAVALGESSLSLPREVEVELRLCVQDELELHLGAGLCTDTLGWGHQREGGRIGRGRT